MTDFVHLDATAQARLVASRDVTPLELVDAAIARIEKINPRINAVVASQFEQARARAGGPLPDGPFCGVPFLLKDLAGGAEKGMPHTYGAWLLAGNIARYDSELVRRYRAAGLVFVGRSSTPEFGIPPVTEAALFGPCRNPWNLDRSPGGSSGGAAAAVAARLVPFAHASDAGGSIRIPASACGLFGLKPTRGRNPMGPNIGESVAGLSVDHCVSVSVRDSAALLDATGAPEPGAPYQAPAPQGTFLAAVYAPPRKLRIGVMREPCNGAAVDPECLAAVETAAALCRALGHEVTDEFPTLADPERFIGAFGKAYMVAAAVNVEMAERLAGHTAGEDDLEPLTREVARLGRTLSAVDYVQVTRELHAAAREFSRFFNDYDLLLSPTLAQPPVVVGELRFAPDSLVADFMRLGEYAPFTQIFNASGQPAMNVPLYWTADGMPVGVQFAGRYGDEATLFALAGELERAQPWASRLPPLAG